MYESVHETVPAVLFSAKFTVIAGSQLSVASTVGAAGGNCPHMIVMSEGTPLIIGAVLSSTTMVCTSTDELPQSSVAVHVLSITYLSAQDPLMVFVVKTISTSLSQLSVAVAGFPNIGRLLHSTVILAGILARTGTSSSPSTVIICSPLTAFPHLSVASQVRVIVYDTVQSTLAAELFSTKVTTGPGSQLSVAIKVGGVGGNWPHVIVKSVGTPLSIGAIVS